MADEGFKVVHRYYITDQKGEINEETPFFDKIEDKPLWDCLYCVEKNGKKGIINLQTGKIVLEPIYEVIKEIPSQYISPRYALLKWRDSEDRTWHGVYELARATGVITRLSETSTRTEYELTCQMRKQFYLTQDYDVWEPNGWDRKDNLLKVIKGQKRGLMNTETCELILDFQFGGFYDIDLGSLDEEGYLKVYLKDVWKVANIKTGKILDMKGYTFIYEFNEHGLALVHSTFEGYETWGMINKEGKEVIPAVNAMDFTIIGRFGYRWVKTGIAAYEHPQSIFDCEENDILFGFNLQEKQWYLYTKSGLSMLFPFNRLTSLYQKELVSYKKFPDKKEELPQLNMRYFRVQSKREILQVKGEKNTFVFPDMNSCSHYPESNTKVKITLVKNRIIVEAYARGRLEGDFTSTPVYRDVFFFKRKREK